MADENAGGEKKDTVDIDAMVKSRVEIELAEMRKKVDEFRANNVELLKAQEKYKGLSDDDIEVIRAGKVNPNKGAESEALLKSLQDKLAETERLANERAQQVARMSVEGYISREIAEYNSKNPTRRVAPGAEEYVIAEAAKTFQYRDGKTLPVDGDRILSGKDGVLTAAEWLEKFREQKQIFFERAAGGGAHGSGRLGAEKPGSLAGDKKDREAALKARFPDLA